MAEKQTNNLFPVLLQMDRMSVLIVGGGNVALEKLTAVVQNAPNTRIRVVAAETRVEIKDLASSNQHLELIQRPFLPQDLEGIDIVFIAVNDPAESIRI